MFKKWGHSEQEDSPVQNTIAGNEEKSVNPVINPAKDRSRNTILKGNKVIGDITVSCDLELSGEIEGNITSHHNSNIVIRGTCRGDILTKEGSVDITGELIGGNITAGSDITISGKFEGGHVKAKGKITLDGEFNGKLEASEIEIGPKAQGSGELFYKDHISVAKGALIEGQICKLPVELTIVKNAPDKEKAQKETPAAKKEASGS